MLPEILFVGVGAAFRFYLGEYKEPKNKTLQKMWLTGLFFRKLDWNECKWYIIHTLWMVKMMGYTLCQRILGNKYYQ